MFLSDFNSMNDVYFFDPDKGRVRLFKTDASGDSSDDIKMRGICQKTEKGWAALYSQNNSLIFQFETTKWNLGDKKTRCEYSVLHPKYPEISTGHFRISNKSTSFETSQEHWTHKAGLKASWEDEDYDMDFFASVTERWKDPKFFTWSVQRWSEATDEIA